MKEFAFKVNLVAVVRVRGKSFLRCLEHPAPLKSD
jgi:hypothetical protein